MGLDQKFTKKSETKYKHIVRSTNMSESETWKESGAILYVAITIIVFVFFVLIAVWAITRRKRKRYSPMNADKEGDQVELVDNNDNLEAKTAKRFTIDGSESESEEEIELYSDKLEDDTLEDDTLEAV